MPTKTIAIDGACRRNGKPDCISAGACFILTEEMRTVHGNIRYCFETNSTSQRGELNGLLLAVEHASLNPSLDTVIITDSEYLFNTITKGWIPRWQANGWKTAQGGDVKNKDLWEQIWSFYEPCADSLTMFHIKGHLMSVGLKKYYNLLYEDTSGYSLYKWLVNNREIKEDKKKHAYALSMENNGFIPPSEMFHRFAAMNGTVDAAANSYLENFEMLEFQSMFKL